MADDVVWVPVLPSLRGFARQLQDEGRRAGEAAGKDTAEAMAASVAKGQAAVQKATSAIEKARNREADAAGRVRVAEAALEDLRSKGITSGQRYTSATEKLAKAQRDAEAAAKATGTAESNLSGAKKTLRDRTDAARKAAEEQGRAVRTSAGEMREAGAASDGLGGKLGSLAKVAGGAVAAFAGFSAVKGMLTKGWGRLTSIDDAQGLLTALGHSAESTAEIMDNAMASVRGTSYGFGDAAQLAAGAVAAGVKPGAELTKYLSRIGDAATIAGTDLSEMGDILNKIQTTNSVYALELNQLAKRGIPIYTWIAEEAGVAASEVKKLASEGGISAEMYFAAIDKNIGGAATAATTVSSAFANTKAAYSRLGATLMTPFFDQAIDGALGLTSIIDRLDAAAKPWAEKLGAGISMVKGILVESDFKGEFGAILGIEEDAPIVDTLFRIREGLQALAAGSLPQLASIFESLKDGALALVDPIGDIVSSLGTAVGAAGVSVWQSLLEVLDVLAPLLADLLVPPFELLAQLMTDHQGVVNALVFAYTGYRAAVIASTVATTLLSKAFAMSPIGRLVTVLTLAAAGVMLLWQNSETFRNIVTGVWEAVQSAVSTAWDVIGSVFEWIGDAVDTVRDGFGWLGDKATWLWESVLSPTFSAIGTAAKVLMAVIATVLIAPFLIAWNLLSQAARDWWAKVEPIFRAVGAVFSWVWENVLSPVFSWIGGAFTKVGSVLSSVWSSVISVVVDALSTAWSALGTAWKWVQESVIDPAVRAFGAVVDWVWDNVVSPTLDFISAGWSTMGDTWQWVQENVIDPAVRKIGEVVDWVWQNVVSPTFDFMKEGVDLVAQSFDKAVEWIGKVWDKIKGIAAKPVEFVIDSVYNNGIRAAWNKVAGWLGLDELEEYKPQWIGSYASGTSVLPGYSPGVDNMRFVSTDGRAAIDLGGGESILRPEVTRAVGPHWVDGVNAAASRGGSGAVRRYLGGFSGGGVVESITDLVNRHFPGMSITSTYRNSNDHHGSGLAVDFSDGYASTPGMRQAAQWFSENYGRQLLELIHNPHPNNVKNGQNVGDGFGTYGAETMAQHGNHVHVAAPGPLDPEMAGAVPGTNWFTNAIGAAVGWLRRRVADAFDAIVNPIGDRIPSFGDSPMGQVPGKAFDMFRDKTRDWLLGKADSQEGAGGTGVPGTGPVVDQVRDVMAAYGWDSGVQWDALDYIIGRESSWNPTAVNSSSGAFGLFQLNPSSGTLQEYLPDRNPNPRIQAEAGARYIRDRYGDPVSARGFWEENNWYDKGGHATGRGVMLKNVLRPERVLSPEQTEAFDALVPHLIDAAAGVADMPALQSALDAFIPGAGLVLDAAGAVADVTADVVDDAVGTRGTDAADPESDFAAFLHQLPGQALEEHSRDTLDFFGLGKLGDLLFAEPDASTADADEPESPDNGVDVVEPAGGADSGLDVVVPPGDDDDSDGHKCDCGPRGPLVVIENLHAFDAADAAEEMERAARRLVRSDALVGGW